jgi:aryl-alcohol dehydrogenase-like predicted oxidoreductase
MGSQGVISRTVAASEISAGSASTSESKAGLSQHVPHTLSPLLPPAQILNGIALMQEKYNIDMSEAAHRWLQHHSALEPEDAVLLGASNVTQVELNLKSWCVLRNI